MHLDQSFEDVRVIAAFCRNKDLRDYLVRAKLHPDAHVHTSDTE